MKTTDPNAGTKIADKIRSQTPEVRNPRSFKMVSSRIPGRSRLRPEEADVSEILRIAMDCFMFSAQVSGQETGFIRDMLMKLLTNSDPTALLCVVATALVDAYDEIAADDAVAACLAMSNKWRPKA